MKTVETAVSAVVNLCAIPRSASYVEQYPEDGPFRYELRIGTPWETGSIIVHEEEVTLTLPEGLDLRGKAVDTLEDKIVEVTKRFNKEVQEMRDQIKMLLLIGHDAPAVDDDALEGELV